MTKCYFFGHNWIVYAGNPISKRTCKRCGEVQYSDPVKMKWYTIGKGYSKS